MTIRTITQSILGLSIEGKVLDLMIVGREFDYTMNDILRGAEVNRKRGKQVVDRFVRLGILKENEKRLKYYKYRKLKFYKFNKNNKLGKLLMGLQNELFRITLKNYEGIEKAKSKKGEREIERKAREFWR